MGILSNIKKIFQKSETGYLSGNSLGLVERLIGENWTDQKNISAYGKSLYVYACVSKIAEKVASIDFKLNKIINANGDTEEVKSHEILDLLYKWNPYFTKEEAIEIDTINRKLTGDSFIYKVRNNAGQLVELWNIRPDRVNIISNKGEYISYYEIMNDDGTRERVEVSEMIHIKAPSPLSEHFGMSPLSSAGNRVQVEEYAIKHQGDMFLNSARPDGLLTTDEPLTAEQRQELSDDFNKRHRGLGKNSKLAVLDSGLKYQQISLSPREMDFIESLKATRDDILIAFKVPKPIVAVLDDVNRANCYSEDTEVLTENGWKKYFEIGEEKIATVNPQNNKIEYHLPTNRFIYDYDGEMVNIETRNTSILVTPNHKMWRRTDKREEYELVEAKDLENSQIKFKASVDYDGDELKEFIIPATKKVLGSNNLTQNQEIKVNADDFIEYLGYFLSEGGLLKETSPNFRYVHTISQKEGEKTDKIRECLDKLPFSKTEYIGKDGVVRWNIYGKSLNSWLRENCGDGCDNKRIPKEFKNLSKRQLRILFDAMMLGDGSWNKMENRNSGYYSSTSSCLADDFQEIALKIGYNVAKAVSYQANGNRKTCYIVHISERKEYDIRKSGERQSIRNVNYSGIVWCFEVPNHIFITRRNGKISIHGNSETAQEIFLSETIVPEMNKLVNKLNEALIIPEWGEEYFLTFEDPTPVNRETRLAEFNAGCDRWISRNEIRQILGMEAIPGGDDLYTQIANVPIAGTARERESKAYKNLRGKRVAKLKLSMKQTIEKQKEQFKKSVKDISEMSLFKDKKKRLEYYNYYNKAIDNQTEKLEKAMIAKKNEQKEKILKALKKKKPKTKADIKKIFNLKEQVKDFKDWILPHYYSIFKQAGDDAMKLISMEPFSIEKAKKPQSKIAKLLEERALFFAQSVNDTTFLALVDTLSEGITAGESIKDLSKRVNDTYLDFNKYRAERIARTETNTVVNEANLEAYRQANAEGKEWIATLDDRVRDEHLLMDGEIVPVDEPFSNGLMSPNEPNCRCAIAPIFKIIR